MTKRLTIALVALAMFVLVAVMPASAYYYNVNTSINSGASVYIGEQGLNLQPAFNAYTSAAKIGYWASAATINTTTPSYTYPLTGDLSSVTISNAAFGPGIGPWYVIYTDGTVNTSAAFFTVKDPQLSVDVWDYSQPQGGIAVSGKSIIQGDNLSFKIGTNMDNAINQPLLRTPQGTDVNYTMDIKVKTDSGNTLTSLLNNNNVANAINKQAVNQPSWMWSTSAAGYWYTSATDANGQLAYPAGTYTVTVESHINAMMDNYLNGGATYTGKTVSEAKTVTVVSNTVKIEANKDSVVRSKPFSVTITGRPNTFYHVWVKGTSTMTGGYDDQPPMLAAYQGGVSVDNQTYVGLNGVAPDAAFSANENGNYRYQNGGGDSILSDVAPSVKTVTAGTSNADKNSMKLGNGTLLYANVSMADSGTRTIQFLTTNWTKAQQYTIRVEQNFSGQFKSDEVNVKVEKGAVTIVAAGDQSYYLGEEIKFSGTNTETQTTYLFISGPNLGSYGAGMTTLDPRTMKLGTQTPTLDQLIQADVQGDNTWSYKWGTSKIALDAGTYTIFATSQPSSSDSDQLARVAYGTVSIIIKKPFISATASQSTVAKGDKVIISGTAQGQPSAGVQIWILGKNYAVVAAQSVNSDASFSYEIKKETTKDLASGQYFVVAQHPMQNNAFDVKLINTEVYNMKLGNTGAGTRIFTLLGAGSLQGSDAAEALVQGINDPNVDDTYTKLQFLVEEPIITITPVGDRHVGDKFTVAATTNLAVDDEVLMEIYSSSFKPTQKSQSGEFSGATGTIKVTKGDSGLNKLSFDVDASTFKPDEYIVKASAVLQDATGTALFNVLEGAAPTAVPTTVVTTAVPTTAVPTTIPTTVATPTKTPTQPGFGALVALIGLGAVALLVVRRH